MNQSKHLPSPLAGSQKTAPASGRRGFVRGLAKVLARLFILVVILVLALPVAVLPVGSAVPGPIMIGLALAIGVLLVLLFRAHWTPRAVGLTLLGMLVILLAAGVASQVYAATPAITAAGRPLPNSIASLEKVSLNGSEQWITVRGQDTSKPVLLYLGMGGPGGGGFASRGLFEPLEEHFVIVAWDEPHTGKSYGAVPASGLNRQRFVEDARALTELLRARFHQDKIYVYGVSWTSILGIWLVQQVPQYFKAYIGNGQMVNTTENDVLGYQLALDYLAQKGSAAELDSLKRNGPTPYRGAGMGLKYVAFLDVLNDYMNAPRYALLLPLIPMFSPEYGLWDKLMHFVGLFESFEAVYPQLEDLDFITQANQLQVPVYFFVGRSDVNAMASLVEKYYNALQAPRKELIWFKDAGHGLNDASMSQFVDEMVNTVLAQNE
jgi:pimeloyl-ACP methyl ester carboxylesterase